MTTTDYPEAIGMFVPENDLFTTNTHQAIVIHKTANGTTAQEIAQYFINVSPGPSVHYVVGLDGTVVQCAPEALGAGGNCCLEQGHDPFWDQFGPINLNTVTLSVEHIDPSLTNSTPCPQAQIDASFKLVLYLANKYHIAPDHIKPHSSLDPTSRAHCPGNYPFTDLISYVQNGGLMIPAGWTDDGTTLRAPNGVAVVLGFRQFVLTNNWHPDNWPLVAEQTVQLLEASNPALGGGQQQLFRWAMLGWVQAQNKVIFEWVGAELLTTRQQLTTYYQLSKKLQAELDSLNAQPAGLDPAKVADRLTAIGLASNNGNTAIQQLVTQAL